ncbi:hypothetical protein HK100_001558 [Physocladia obscura]|uniref:ABC1 atypical kinase-like domain-containing protein n=1 Tax=Physocladia obscura TaxID=109957 RepID=A0AAD5T2N6_9FUNG|nr:hypothetical protein HK100_001558 [Physocladia obscura]
MLRMQRGLRIAAVAGGVGVGLWQTDRVVFCSAGERSLRTLAVGVRLAWMYKFEFEPATYDAVHAKAADLILETCKKNSGLYIKFAQQIATVSNILPPQWNGFRALYDNAPAVPLSSIERVFAAEFAGKQPSDLFDDFEPVPRASASIAQVHRARLKNSRQYVAVKVQKPDVAVQVEADLLSFGVVMHLLQALFDLKLSWTLPSINSHLRQELDFVNEARNAEMAREHMKQVEAFRGGVVAVPRIYWELTTPRIMTAEWIDGQSFGDVEGVRRRWGPENVEKMMATLVNVYADQLFRTGFLSADPHPGNILIRPSPTNPKIPQLVLLDHGLYIRCSSEFVSDYRNLWVSLFSHKVEIVERIVKKWGIRDVQLFAIGTLQKPWTKKVGFTGDINIARDVLDFEKVERDGTDGKLSVEQRIAMQAKMKQRVQEYLENTDVIPRELIFVGRNLNIIRSNNKIYGSPVNRINLTAQWAIKVEDEINPTKKSLFDIPTAVKQARQYSTLTIISVGFYLTRLWNSVYSFYEYLKYDILGIHRQSRSGSEKKGFEEIMEDAVRKQLYEQTGVLLDKTAFD